MTLEKYSTKRQKMKSTSKERYRKRIPLFANLFFFESDRKTVIKPFYYHRPKMLKFILLLQSLLSVWVYLVRGCLTVGSILLMQNLRQSAAGAVPI